LDTTSKIAVALKYDPSLRDAPFVVAKGKEWLAERIIEEAEKHGVPIVSSPEIVHDLYELGVLQEIPQHLYKAVAEIILFVSEL
jgi:flagellar biosynthesis protein